MIADLFLKSLLVSLAISFVATPFVIKLARRFNLLDDPKKHKHPAILHKKPIPRAGGLAIFVGIALATILIVPMDTQIVIILFAGFLVVATGLLDDKYDLSPYVRFGSNIFCAILVVATGVSLPFITNPLGGILSIENLVPMLNFTIGLPQILAVIWIVWVMNMLNWSKGVDGQMPGIAAISAVIIGIASLRFPVLTSENIQVSQIAFIVGGASLGFLIFNYYPAKIFPGYSATILGFFLGILSLISGVKLATAILVMGVPTVDALFTVVRRIASGRSPFWHDRQHLHHLLLSRGWGHRRIAAFYWSMSLLLGVVALSLSSKGKLFAIMVLIVLVTGMIFSLRIFNKKSLDDES